MRTEEARAVESALAALSPRHRLVLRLRHFEHLSFEQIGHRVDLSTAAARQLWARAIKNLRRELKAAGRVPETMRRL
jgi:RNA polymerase sigma-70 factor (ECF subfamily)